MNRERRAAGQTSKADSSAATTPAALCELGHRHLGEGRALDAQLCCEQALAADPDFAEAMHLMGLLSLRAGQIDHAIEWLSRAVPVSPEAAAAMVESGFAEMRAGRLAEGLALLDRAD